MKGKISVSFGAFEVKEFGWSELDEKIEAKAVVANRWRLGIILIGERKFDGSRRKTLEGYEYKVGNQITGKVDGFTCTEYMDWRDK